MRVGLPSPAGSSFRRLVLLVVLVAALPASAQAQDPVPVPGSIEFVDPPTGVRPPVAETLRWTAPAEAERFECAVDDEPIGDCDSPWPVGPLGDGSHEFTVRGFAGDVLVAERTHIWTVDAVKPVVSFLSGPSGPSPAGPAEVAFEGGGDTVDFECSLDGSDFAGCSSPLDVTVTAGVTQELRVRAIDAVGNIGDPVVRSWSGLRPAPGTPVITGAPEGTVPERTASISFTAQGAAGFECAVDSDDPADLAGCTPPLRLRDLADGSHFVVVRGVAADGTRGAVARAAWIVDSQGPSVGIPGRPADPSRAGSATFTLAPSEDAESMLCRLTGPGRQNAEFETCDATPTYEGLTSGRYTFTVQAFDRAGNASPEVSHAWTVDLDAPVLSLAAAPPATTPAATVQLAWAASEPVSGVECRLDDEDFEPCGLTVSVPNAARPLGSRRFAIRAVDAAGNLGTAQTGWTTSFEPAFDWDPEAAVIERPLTFTSRSAGDLRALAWDLDGDGFDDGDGPTATRTFAEPGTYLVRLRVTHRDGADQTLERQVTVGRTPLIVPPPVTPGPDRRPPVAGFGVAPQPPVAGQPVTLTSTSSDPDGAIASWAWDLDGDGAFDDAAGPAAARSYPAGTHVVGLLVVDTDGLSATVFASVEVAAAPGSAGPAPSVAKKLSRLTPFPVVRIAGTAVGSRVRLRIFAIRAPRGTTVDVRCRGRGCPLTTFRQRVAGKTRTVRVRKLEQRALRAGTVIEVRVLAAGRIGKYTRLVMRSGAAPRRTDACVSGTRSLKIACPA